MSPPALEVLIATGGFLMSVLASVFIAGTFKGRTDTRLAMLEKTQDTLATKDQLAGVKEDLAEIKGMFRMTLKDGTP